MIFIFKSYKYLDMNIMERIVKQLLKPILPPEVSIDLSNDSNGNEVIEIGVSLETGNSDLYNLCHPRLYGEVKKVNGTWSVNFSIDFLVLKDKWGDLIFEAETKPIVRTQFKSKESMISRLQQVYSEYHQKLLNCNFDTDGDIIEQINAHFEGSIARLQLVDSDWHINIAAD